MPQETTMKVRVEGTPEAGQKLRVLNGEIDSVTKRFAQLEVEAQRAGLTGIRRIQFEENRKLEQLARDFREQMERIRESEFKGQDEIRKRILELRRQTLQTSVAISQEADAKIAQSQEKTFTLMSKRLGSFVDRWGKGAKDLSVVWDRIQNEMALSLSKFLFRMLFQWDVAMKAMQELTKRGFLGSLFSLGGGIPGSTGSLFGTIGGLAGTITGSRVAHTSRRDVCGSRVNIEAAR